MITFLSIKANLYEVVFQNVDQKISCRASTYRLRNRLDPKTSNSEIDKLDHLIPNLTQSGPGPINENPELITLDFAMLKFRPIREA